MGHLRRMMRGYRRLRASGEPERIARTREALTVTPVMNGERGASPLFFGASGTHTERAVRQFVLTSFGNLGLTAALLRSLAHSGGTVTAPLPPRWREVLEARGFRVSRVWSAVAWNGYLVLYLGYGILGIARRIVSGAMG
jgi:hypothetical protein